MDKKIGRPKLRVNLNWKGIILLFTVLFLLAFGVFQPALAKGLILQGDVPSGTVVENDLFLVGESPSIDGTVHGDVFVVGNNVSITGEIDGSLFLVSQTAQIGNQVQGTGYTASLELTLAPEAALQRNLYFIGLSLIMQPGSSIGRDLVALSLGAQLDGTVQRNVIAVIGPLEILNTVLRLLDAPPIRLRDIGRTSAIPALLARHDLAAWSLNSTAGLLGWVGLPAVRAAMTADAASPHNLERSSQQAGEIDWTQVGDWAVNRLKDLVVLLVFGLLAGWLFPARLTGSAKALHRKPLAALGIGLLALVLAINLFGVVMLLAVLFLIIGLWVGTLGLWAITLAFWAVVYPALALASALFWLFVIFGTKVIAAYFIGDWLLGKLAPKAANRFLAVFLGLLIYVLLAGIPMVGWVISVLVTSFGLGAAWLELRSRPPKEPVSTALPVEESSEAPADSLAGSELEPN